MMMPIAGLTAAIYVKFCSGPTPRYARPGRARRVSSGMTRCAYSSFETRLSERKRPSGSDNSAMSLKNSAPLRRTGRRLAESAQPGQRLRPDDRRQYQQRDRKQRASGHEFRPIPLSTPQPMLSVWSVRSVF